MEDLLPEERRVRREPHVRVGPKEVVRARGGRRQRGLDEGRLPHLPGSKEEATVESRELQLPC